MADSNGIEDISDEEDEENDLDEFEVIDELDDEEDEIKYEIDQKRKLSTVSTASSKQSAPIASIASKPADCKKTICTKSTKALSQSTRAIVGPTNKSSTEAVTKPATATTAKSTTMPITKSTTTAAQSASATSAKTTDITSKLPTSTVAASKRTVTPVKATATSVSKPAAASAKPASTPVSKPAVPPPKSTTSVSKPAVASVKSTTTPVSKPSGTPVKSTMTPVSKPKVTPVKSTTTPISKPVVPPKSTTAPASKPTVISARSTTRPVSKSTVVSAISATCTTTLITPTTTPAKANATLVTTPIVVTSTTALITKQITTPAKANTTPANKPIITPTKSTVTKSPAKLTDTPIIKTASNSTTAQVTKSTVIPTSSSTSRSTTSHITKSTKASIAQPTVTYTNSTTPQSIKHTEVTSHSMTTQVTETPATSTTASAILSTTTVITTPTVSVAKSATIQVTNPPVTLAKLTMSISKPTISTATSTATQLSTSTTPITTILVESTTTEATTLTETASMSPSASKQTVMSPTQTATKLPVAATESTTNTSESTVTPDKPAKAKSKAPATSTATKTILTLARSATRTVPKATVTRDKPKKTVTEPSSSQTSTDKATSLAVVSNSQESITPDTPDMIKNEPLATSTPLLSENVVDLADPQAGASPSDERCLSPVSEGATSSCHDEGGLSPISDAGRFSPVSDKEGSNIIFSDDEGGFSPVSDKPGGFSPISAHGETEFDRRSLSPVSDKSVSSTHSEKQHALSPVSDKSLKREWSPVLEKVESPVEKQSTKSSTPENQIKTTNEDNFILKTQKDDGTSGWRSSIYEYYDRTLFVHPMKPIDLIHAHLRPMLTQCESVIARFTGASGSDKNGHVQLRFPSADVTDDIYKKMSAKKFWKPNIVVSRPGQITSFSVGTWLLDDGNEVSLPNDDAGSKTLVYVSNITADATKQMFRALFPRATNIDIVKNGDDSNTGVARLEFLTRQIAETSVANVEKYEMNGKRLSMHIISSKSQTEGVSRSSSVVNNDQPSSTHVMPSDVKNHDRPLSTCVTPPDAKNHDRPLSTRVTPPDVRNTNETDAKQMDKHKTVDRFGRSRELRQDPKKRTAGDVIVIDDEEEAAKKARLRAICAQFTTVLSEQSTPHHKQAVFPSHGQGLIQKYPPNPQPFVSGGKRPFPGTTRNERPVAKFRRVGSPIRELNHMKIRSVNQLAANKALTLAKSMALKQRLHALQQQQQQQQQRRRQQQALPRGVMMPVPNLADGPPTVYLRPRAPLFPAAASLTRPPVLNPNLLRYLSPQLQQPRPVAVQTAMPPVVPIDPILGSSDQGVWSNLAPGDLQQVQQQLYPGQVLMPPPLIGDINAITRFSVPHKAPSLEGSNFSQQQQRHGLAGNKAILKIDVSNDKNTQQKRTVSEHDLACSFVDKWSSDPQNWKKTNAMMVVDPWHNPPQKSHTPQHPPPNLQHPPPHNPLHPPPNVQHPPPHNPIHPPPNVKHPPPHNPIHPPPNVKHLPPHNVHDAGHHQSASHPGAPLRWMSGRPDDDAPSNLSRSQQTFDYGHGHQLPLQPRSKMAAHLPNPPRSQLHPPLLQSVPRTHGPSNQFI